MCFAGWAVLLHDGPEELERLIKSYSAINWAISDRAQEILGLTNLQKHSLFSYRNNMEDLRDLVMGGLESLETPTGGRDRTYIGVVYGPPLFLLFYQT